MKIFFQMKQIKRKKIKKNMKKRVKKKEKIFSNIQIKII